MSAWFPPEPEGVPRTARRPGPGGGGGSAYTGRCTSVTRPAAPRSIQTSPQRETGGSRNSPSPPSAPHPLPLSVLHSGPRAFKGARAVRTPSSSSGSESGWVLPPDGEPPEPLRRAAHAGGRGHRRGPPVRLHHPHRRWVNVDTHSGCFNLFQLPVFVFFSHSLVNTKERSAAQEVKQNQYWTPNDQSCWSAFIGRVSNFIKPVISELRGGFLPPSGHKSLNATLKWSWKSTFILFWWRTC